jgi:oligopeptide transport system ATP-binding protein
MILEVKGLKKYFPVKGKKGEFVRAVDGIDFTVREGETFGLVGESGCGKSTTARLIIRLLTPTDGSIYFQGEEISKLSKAQIKEFRKNVQMVFQDPYASLHPRMTIEQTLMEPMKIFGIGTINERKKRVAELLEIVGLDARYAKRYPHEFSGGQRQRIGIARALVLNPKLIILDEPVSALDVSIQSQIINLLKQLQREFNLTYLFISHDLSVVEYMCDRIGVMYLGKMVEVADKQSLFNNPQHPYTQALLSAIPQPDPEIRRERIYIQGDPPSPVDPPSGCSFHPRCPKAIDICGKIKPKTIQAGNNHSVSCHLYDSNYNAIGIDDNNLIQRA